MSISHRIRGYVRSTLPTRGCWCCRGRQCAFRVIIRPPDYPLVAFRNRRKPLREI